MPDTQVFNVQFSTAPPKCIGLPIKLAHDVTYKPALLKLNERGVFIVPSSERTHFLKGTQMALKSSESDLFEA